MLKPVNLGTPAFGAWRWRVALASVAALAFAGSVFGELVWDGRAVVEISAQRSAAQVLTRDLFGNVTANYYRPLVAPGFHALRRLVPDQT